MHIHKLTPSQQQFYFDDAKFTAYVAGLGCLHGDTLVMTEQGLQAIKDIREPCRVVSWNANVGDFQMSLCGGSFIKGRGHLVQVCTRDGVFRASEHHRVLTPTGYIMAGDLKPGDTICSHPKPGKYFRYVASLHNPDEHTQPHNMCTMGNYASTARWLGEQCVRRDDTATAPRLWATFTGWLMRAANRLYSTTTPTMANDVYKVPEGVTTVATVRRDALPSVFYDLQVLDTHNYITADGAIHHNSGKTMTGALKLLRLCFKYPTVNHLYAAPNYRLVSDIFYPKVAEVAELMGVRCVVRRSSDTVELDGAGIILCRTMEKEERLVGFEVGSALLDELDIMPTDKAITAFRKVMGRLRTKYPDGSPNRMMVTSTPEGFKALYKLFVKTTNPHYSLTHGSTYENEPNLPEGYVASMLESYPPQLIQAYLEGQFVNLTSGRVYPNFDRKLNHTDIEPKPGEPLHIGMDFNVNFGASVAHVIRDGMAYAVDEVCDAFDTQTQINAWRERYPRHAIYCYPDASGKNRTSGNTTSTDISLLTSAGFKVIHPNANPMVKSRVAAYNAQILNAKGERRYKVNTKKCPKLTEALEAQVYDATNQPDKKSGYDHVNDAGGYFIVQKFPIISNDTRTIAVAI